MGRTLRGAKAPRREPKYRRQKRRSGDLAFVEYDGQRHYLGAWGSEGSRRRYHRLLAEWETGNAPPPAQEDGLTVLELISRFWAFAEEHYGREADGVANTEAENFRPALRLLKELYGDMTAGDFGPRALKTLRRRMLEAGNARTYVNQNVRRLRRVFKWAVAEELIEPAVYQALAAVDGLRAGRGRIRESQPVAPVPQESVDTIRPFVSRQVWAMVQLQLLSAARSGELVVLRPQDIDNETLASVEGTSVWTYTPSAHKTAHLGKNRTIYFGPKAQAILRPFLVGRARDAYVFVPAEAELERLARRHAERTTPASRGNAPGTNRVNEPARKAGERYTTASYRRAIERACERARIPHWHPHQLRHVAATNVRKEFGLEVARVVLGHASPLVTEMYAELDREKAVEVIARIG